MQQQQRERRRCCAVVLARGGSKDIPKKNLQLYGDKPLLWYPLEAAHESSLIDDRDVWVSTDDDEIAASALEVDAGVIERPAYMAQDASLDIDAMRHFFSVMSKRGVEYDYVVHLRATFPHITGEIIDRAIKQFEMAYDGYDSLRSVIKVNQTPWKMWFMTSDGYLEPVISDSSEAHSMPRQMLRQAYWQNAAVDIIKSWTITEFRSMTGDRIMPFVMDSIYDLDIDTPGDLARAKGKV